MENKGKAALAIGGIGLAGLLGYLLTRKPAPPAPPPEGPAAAIKIEVLGPEGIPVKGNSPVTLDEGATYTVVATVTNQTFRAGQPWEATLETWIMAAADMTDLIPGDVWTELFAPNEARSYTSALVIPDGYGGMTGAITVDVFDPEGNLLATASEPLTIRSLAIIYGATVTIGI